LPRFGCGEAQGVVRWVFIHGSFQSAERSGTEKGPTKGPCGTSASQSVARAAIDEGRIQRPLGTRDRA
jgi:hypothetical protein